MPPMNDSMSTKSRSENVKKDPPDLISCAKVKSNGGEPPPSPPPIPPCITVGGIQEMAPYENGQPEPPQKGIQDADEDAQLNGSGEQQQPNALDITTNGNDQNGERSPQPQGMQDNSVNANGSDILGQNGQEPLLQGIHASANGQPNGHHNGQQQPGALNTNCNGHISPSQNGQEQQEEDTMECALNDGTVQLVINQNGELEPPLEVEQQPQGLQSAIRIGDVQVIDSQSPLVLPLHVMNGQYYVQLDPNSPLIANGMPVGSVTVTTDPSSTLSPPQQQQQQQLPSQTASTSSVGDGWEIALDQNGHPDPCMQGINTNVYVQLNGGLYEAKMVQQTDTSANAQGIGHQSSEGPNGLLCIAVPSMPFPNGIPEMNNNPMQVISQNDAIGLASSLVVASSSSSSCSDGEHQLQPLPEYNFHDIEIINATDWVPVLNQLPPEAPVTVEDENLNVLPMAPVTVKVEDDEELDVLPMAPPADPPVSHCSLSNSLVASGMPYRTHVTSHAMAQSYCPLCAQLVHTYNGLEAHLIECTRENEPKQEWRRIMQYDLLRYTTSWITVYSKLNSIGELDSMAGSSNPHGYYRFKCRYCFDDLYDIMNQPFPYPAPFKLSDMLSCCSVMFPQYGHEVKDHIERMHPNDGIEPTEAMFVRYMFVAKFERILYKNAVSRVWMKDEQELYTLSECRVFMRSAERSDKTVDYMAQMFGNHLPVYPPGYPLARRGWRTPPPSPPYDPPSPQEPMEDEDDDEGAIVEEVIPMEGEAGPSQPKRRRLSYLGQSVLNAAIGSIGPKYGGKFKLAVQSAHFMPNQAGAEPPENVVPIDVSCSTLSPQAQVRRSKRLDQPGPSCRVITVKPVNRPNGKVAYKMAKVASRSKQANNSNAGPDIIRDGMVISESDDEDEDSQNESVDEVANGDDDDEDVQTEPVAEMANDDDDEESQNEPVPEVPKGDNEEDTQKELVAEVANGDNDENCQKDPVDEVANSDDDDEDNDGEDGYGKEGNNEDSDGSYNLNPLDFFLQFQKDEDVLQLYESIPKIPKCNATVELYMDPAVDEDDEYLDEEEELDEELDEEEENDVDDEEQLDGDNDQEEPNVDEQANLSGNMDEEMKDADEEERHEDEEDEEDYIVLDESRPQVSP